MTGPDFVERTIAAVQRAPLASGALSPAGNGSIYKGSAGVAFFLFEVARLEGRKDLLDLAAAWSDVAFAQEVSSEAPFGFLGGAAGLHAVAALASAASGNADRARKAVADVDACASKVILETGAKPSARDLVLGAAGLAAGAGSVAARLSAETSPVARATLLTVSERVAGELLKQYSVPLALGPRDPLGFAHGVAGELWALAVTVGARHDSVHARLRELAALGQRDEEGLVYWLSCLESESLGLLPTWCHGMPGHTLLWCEVARQTGENWATDLATACALSVDALDDATDAALCCGLTGQALALQRYAALSGDQRFAKAAEARLVRALEMPDRSSPSEGGLSLWRGDTGIALCALYARHEQHALPILEMPTALP